MLLRVILSVATHTTPHPFKGNFFLINLVGWGKKWIRCYSIKKTLGMQLSLSLLLASYGLLDW